MSHQPTAETVVEREIQALWNGHDRSRVDELYSEDVVLHYPGQPPIHGREQLTQFLGMYLSAFPDLSMRIDELIGTDGLVACRYTQRGTHRGPLLGLEPTGERIEISGMLFRRVENGAIAEMWVNDDSVGMLQQLDVFSRLARPNRPAPPDSQT